MIAKNDWITLYYDWLKDNTIAKTLSNGWTEIATPFLDRHNDGLIVYLKKDGDNITISDDGYIIADLLNSGCSLSGTTRKKMLKTFLYSYGISLKNNSELVTTATLSDFPQKKHMMIQAMSAVNDMFMLTKENIASIFTDDISAFFDEKNILYTPDAYFMGRSGLNQRIDFVIPRSVQKNKPERFVFAINSPRVDIIQQKLFSWNDVKINRPNVNTDLLIFLNDIKSIDNKIIDAIVKYEAKPILWSKREDYIEEFVA